MHPVESYFIFQHLYISVSTRMVLKEVITPRTGLGKIIQFSELCPLAMLEFNCCLLYKSTRIKFPKLMSITRKRLRKIDSS